MRDHHKVGGDHEDCSTLWHARSSAADLPHRKSCDRIRIQARNSKQPRLRSATGPLCNVMLWGQRLLPAAAKASSIRFQGADVNPSLIQVEVHPSAFCAVAKEVVRGISFSPKLVL
ncbi:hypothetical protein NXC24_PB00054 (plasmid) [Rhizobium sp. NXC24]|nr:hypothetical protein NXC24_PB00054 [Rhizobium sp. NXC24]